MIARLISALVGHNPAEAQQTIERLSSLLRASLDAAETVPLERELKLVTDYLEIQRTRLGERLRYDVSVASDARASVPPFAIQLDGTTQLHVARDRVAGVKVKLGV